MISVSNVVVTPAEISCGELVEISATITFAGPPREVTVVVEVQAPCTFGGATRMIEVRRDGLSPHTVRVVEPVYCPQGESEYVSGIRVGVKDGRGGYDRAYGRVIVRGEGS